MPHTLTMGRRYDLDRVRAGFLGWNAADVAGYHLSFYFDTDGHYLGPDADDVEPLVSDPDAAALPVRSAAGGRRRNRGTHGHRSTGAAPAPASRRAPPSAHPTRTPR